MKLLHKKVLFFSTPANYKKEKKGVKNNTVIILNDKRVVYEFEEWRKAKEKYIKDEKLQIEICDNETKKSFYRKITDITVENITRDNVLIIFSFKK